MWYSALGCFCTDCLENACIEACINSKLQLQFVSGIWCLTWSLWFGFRLKPNFRTKMPKKLLLMLKVVKSNKK